MARSAITIRLELKTIHEVEKWAEILRLRPSTLLSMVINDKLQEWIREYAESINKEVEKLR